MFQLPEEVKKSMENYKRSLEEAQEDGVSSARLGVCVCPGGFTPIEMVAY